MRFDSLVSFSAASQFPSSTLQIIRSPSCEALVDTHTAHWLLDCSVGLGKFCAVSGAIAHCQTDVLFDKLLRVDFSRLLLNKRGCFFSGNPFRSEADHRTLTRGKGFALDVSNDQRIRLCSHLRKDSNEDSLFTEPDLQFVFGAI